MKRTFHNSPGALFALSASLFIIAGGYFLWIKMPIPAVLFLLFAIIHIERTIHTEYVIDSTTLTIRRGRLSTPTVIPLHYISAANRFRPNPLLFIIPRPTIVVLVLRAKPRPILITPANPDDFIKVLCANRQSHAQTNENVTDEANEPAPPDTNG